MQKKHIIFVSVVVALVVCFGYALLNNRLGKIGAASSITNSDTVFTLYKDVNDLLNVYANFSTTTANTWTTTQAFTATSTGTKGFNITGGCFAINGTCLSSGASSTILADANTWSNTGTSTYSGNVKISGNLQVTGNFFAPVQIVSSGNATINGALTVTGNGLFGNTGGVYAGAAGAGIGGIGFNSVPDGSYTAGVTGFGALWQLALSTGVFTMFTESNVSAGAAHSHIEAMHWDSTGIVYVPQGIVANASSTIGSLVIVSKLTVTNASSTNLTASQSLYAADSAATVSRITGTRALSFGLSTSTLWTGTSTVSSAFGDAGTVYAPFTGSFSTIQCGTNVGTLGINVQDGGGSSVYIKASSTANTNTFSLSFTKGDALKITGGNPTTAPTSTACTLIGSES